MAGAETWFSVSSSSLADSVMSEIYCAISELGKRPVSGATGGFEGNDTSAITKKVFMTLLMSRGSDDDSELLGVLLSQSVSFLEYCSASQWAFWTVAQPVSGLFGVLLSQSVGFLDCCSASQYCIFLHCLHVQEKHIVVLYACNTISFLPILFSADVADVCSHSRLFCSILWRFPQ